MIFCVGTASTRLPSGRQLSGSGEGPGTGRGQVAGNSPGDGDEDQGVTPSSAASQTCTLRTRVPEMSPNRRQQPTIASSSNIRA
jgi:hypothetical protein